MTIAPVHSATRNATLAEMVDTLKKQQAVKHDIVVSATKLASVGGVLIVEGGEVEITADGVTPVDGAYVPTAVFDEGISRILGIPLAYVRRMREERPDLYDANVNGWLLGNDVDAPDPRKFLVRLFRGADGSAGVARSIHSDSYGRIDNFDTLMAALEGIRDAGITTVPGRTDLTDRHMYVEFSAPEVAALAPTLLGNYRSPFSGQSGSDLPTVFAGFILRNSETGCGAYSLTPRLVVEVCTNGLTRSVDALRSIHRGSTMDEGVVNWSVETQRRTLALISSKTTDAVKTFLTQEYVERVVAELEAQSGTPVTAKPADAIATLSTALKFDDDTAAGILEHFLTAGDKTAGGILGAVTSYAQTVEDADAARELEVAGEKAFALAVKGL